MAVSVVEVVVGAGTSLGTSPTITLTSAPQAGDFVVVAMQCSAVVTVSAASGLGATWTKVTGSGIEDGANASTCSIWIGAGATTAGTVTLTLSQSRAGSLRAFTVRGIVGESCPAVSTSNISTSLTSTTVSASQFVLGLGFIGRTSATTIFSATVPAPGWVAQANSISASGTDGSAYYIPSGPTNHSVSVATSSTSSERTTILSLGGTTPRIAAGEYVEAVTVSSTTPRTVSAEYVEAMTLPLITPRSLSAYYIEVITPATLVVAQRYVGWGQPR